MDDVLGLEVSETHEKVLCKPVAEPLVVWEAVTIHQIRKNNSFNVFHYEVDFALCTERLLELDYVRVAKPLHDRYLIVNQFQLLLRRPFLDREFEVLEREEFIIGISGDLENL